MTVHVYGDPTLWLQLSVEIGDERAKTLAAGVAASGSLAELYLTSNGIGNEGAKSLAAGVAASRSMARLLLDVNNIGADAKQSLCDAVQGRQGFNLGL